MAQSNQKKKSSSKKVQKKITKRKINPFEVHINKQKLTVLGRKVKNDRGIPGISRAKALKKRKHTLEKEYKSQHKVNTFRDKRIGENDIHMSQEGKFAARYATLIAKKHKKSIFNLANEEILTHKGQTLSEIEKFDSKPDDDDSFDEEDRGTLDANFVKEAHFGGGFLTKTHTDGSKTHKDLIDKLIAESKKRKAEKKMMKEQTLQLTEKLDVEWRDLMPLINTTKFTNAINTDEKADEYDKIVKQLKFEARGNPSDRLKTDDEIAKEALETMKQLETECFDRMHGFPKENFNKQHISADDLDDNYAYDSDVDITLSYNKEGVANVSIKGEVNGKSIALKENDVDEEENIDEDITNKESSNDSSDETSEEEEEDNLSDLKEDELESESDDETENMTYIHNETEKKSENTFNEDTLEKEEISKNSKTYLSPPYNIPKNYEDFQKLLHKKTGKQQSIIIEGMIKHNRASLGKNNVDNFNILFAYLLQHINDLYSSLNKSSINSCLNIYSHIVQHIYDLAQMNEEATHKSLLEVIKEKHQKYRKRSNHYPEIDTLIFLKLVSCLFSTSDFKHMVVTPSFVFIDQMLNKCKVRTRKDISFGLFLTTLVLEYTVLSKRFLPSAINFLDGILHMCIPKTGIKLVKICPPFKSSQNTLVLFNNWEMSDLNLNMEFSYLLDGEIGDECKIRIFYTALSLLDEFLENFKDLQSNYEIFIPVENYLDMIPINNYPSKVREKSQILRDKLTAMKTNRSLEYLVMSKPRPKALRLYEPNIVKIYDSKRHKVTSKEKAERNKLVHKLKREKKGALREIKRDQAYLAKLKINEQIRSDNERKEKVRKLLSEASIQQSEFNAMDRKKARKK